MTHLDAARSYSHLSIWVSQVNSLSGTSSTAPGELEAVPQVGDLIGGRYRISAQLGQGGMGVVLGGEHLDLRQLVAIKVLRPALAKEPDALARFLREARAAASIRSRHAVRIYDVATTETGVPYMVMERLHGTPVDVLLAQQGPLPIVQAVQIIVEAAEAISEAHGLGIVHRDVKPSNLFLADDSLGVPLVKVLDFGISKRVAIDAGIESASLTAPQTILGSPRYMSPEQLRDPRSVDARTDVWGLGITLYELLTGRMPFECDSIPELCSLIFTCVAPRADILRADIPASLADVLEQCLTKRSDDRIESVAALVVRLKPFCRVQTLTVAEQMARTAAGITEDVTPVRRSRSRSRRRAFLAGTTAASVAVGSMVYFSFSSSFTRPRARSAFEPVNAPTASTIESATTAAVLPANAPAALTTWEPNPAGSSTTVANEPSPAAPPSSARPEPLIPSPLAPAGLARPRGLKGIKLMD